MSHNAQRFTDKDALLQSLHDHAQSHESAEKSLVLAIAGGSASGKTTIARAMVERLGEHRALLLSQDLFQMGSDFEDRKTSAYRWDDPKNFDLVAGCRALTELRSGKTATVPCFDVVANKRQGSTEIVPLPIIVWEGIYAFLTPELRDRADIAVLIDAPYVLRLLRRISRFLDRKEIDDISTPARHMLTFVLRADIDFVSTQRSHATMILDVALQDLKSEVALFTERATRHASLMASLPQEEPMAAGRFGPLEFRLYRHAFVICDDDGNVLYGATLDDATAESAMTSWPYLEFTK